MVQIFDILVVDDDPVHCRLLESYLKELNKSYKISKSAKEALLSLNNLEYQFNHIFIDLFMPKMSGFELLKEIKSFAPHIPCIILTSHSSVNYVIETMQAGASDFIIKPASPERIQSALAHAAQVKALRHEVTELKKNANPKNNIIFPNMISASETMKKVLKLAMRAAPSMIPVLIDGESGTGKEVMANAIVAGSPRHNAAFITINCGALPQNLMESILFGHEKGAFTGASEKHTGKFVEANGGTIFLDEIGELPLDMQVKLLRVLQNGDVDAVGSKKSTKVDVRVISATNRDLAQMVHEGTFREDLFYRLNVLQITLPPLRNRPEDLELLMHHFIQKSSQEEDKPTLSFTPEAFKAMLEYHWPGNIRQLENVIFRASILCDSVITLDDLPNYIVNAHLYKGDSSRRKNDRRHG
jgi:DNA-binding NtrC family response regulator